MEITFLGSNTYKLKTKSIVVVGNPKGSKERADVAYSVSSELGTEILPATRDVSFPLVKDGEYELGMVSFVFEKLSDAKDVTYRVCTVRSESVVFVDLSGYLGNDLAERHIERFSEADVLIADIKNASWLLEKLAPLYVILVGYANEDELNKALEGVKFENLKKDLDKLKIDADSLPESTEVVALHV